MGFQVIILAWVIPPVFVQQASFEAVDVRGINNIIREVIPYAGNP